MHVCSVVGRQDPDSGFLAGVFSAAYRLRDSGALEAWEEEWLAGELGWLKMHLEVPACLRNPVNRRAICWFHPCAKRPIEKVRTIVALVEERGVPVETIKSPDPGWIISEDGWQVVAKPGLRSPPG